MHFAAAFVQGGKWKVNPCVLLDSKKALLDVMLHKHADLIPFFFLQQE